MNEEKKIVIKTIRLKSGLFSTFIVLLCIGLGTAYTVAVLEISKMGFAVPDALTVAVFAAITGELWNMKEIYKAKKGGNS